jgi:hypothetical protein
METIIKGKELGTFITTALSIGMSKNENSNGVKSRFVVVSCKDEAAIFAGRTRKFTIFEEDFGKEYIDILMKYADPGTNPDTFNIRLEDFKKSDDAKGVMGQLLRWEGACEEFYPFEKGLCYANRADGTAMTDKEGKRVISSGVTVLCLVKAIRPDQTGKMVTHYIEPFSPHTVGSRIERTFYKEAVTVTNTTVENAGVAPANINPSQIQVGQAGPTQAAPTQAPVQNPTQAPNVNPAPGAPAF